MTLEKKSKYTTRQNYLGNKRAGLCDVCIIIKKKCERKKAESTLHYDAE